jgi:hypothetical protein
MSHGCQDLLLIGASKSSRPNCGQLRATLEVPPRCTLGAVLQRRRPNRHRTAGAAAALVWGGMKRHGRPRIAAVCDACRRRKRSAAFERRGRLAAAAADAADGIGHAARSTTTRRAVCAILSQGGRPADKDQELKGSRSAFFADFGWTPDPTGVFLQSEIILFYFV